MSQQVFADRLGKSKSWVDKVERGVRRLDKFSTIAEIADVLQVDVSTLTGREQARKPESGTCVDQVEVVDMRVALEQYDKIGAFYAERPVAPPLTELCKAVDHAWMTFQHAKYSSLARALPRLIRDAQAAEAVHGHADDQGSRQRRTPAYLLTEVYQIASATLCKLGEHDLAWLAADRAMLVCQSTGDHLLSALATEQVAAALLALGRVRPALELSMAIAHQIKPAEDDLNAERLSVYGTVLMRAVLAAARLGDTSTVRELLGQAEMAAKKVGDENHLWTSFGPTNVAFCQVAAEVELGDAARALRTHDGIDHDGYMAMLPERRASHLIDVARAYALVGDMVRAGETLVEADRFAPNEVRCRPDSQELVAEVIRRTNVAPAAALLELVDQIGLSAHAGTARS